MSEYKYRAAGISDIGNVKEINQDSFVLKMGSFGDKPFVFAAIADGMGGVAEGELASRSLTAALSNWVNEHLKKHLTDEFNEETFAESIAEDWDLIIRSVSRELNYYSYEKGYPEGRGPGSTICLLFLYDGTYYIANIGDSRIYRKRGTIKQLTIDHSWAEEAKRHGFTEEQIENDPRKNAITKCVGTGLEPCPDADFFIGEYEKGDIFLLCSDGLRRVIDEDAISEVLEEDRSNLKEKCRIVIDKAKEQGERDNITAVLVSIIKDDDESFFIEETATESLIAGGMKNA